MEQKVEQTMILTTTGKVLAQLVKAQEEIKHAKNDATNPHYNSKYASLESVLDACKPIWTKHGLAVTQGCSPDGKLLITSIHHGDSGQTYHEAIPLVLEKQNMQGVGSAFTYARRYGLEAIFGIGEIDDDGNGAVEFKPPQAAPRQLPNAAAKFTRPPSNEKPTALADTLISFGKHKGKTFSQVGQKELYQYIKFLTDSADNEGKPLGGSSKSMKDEADKWFQEIQMNSIPQAGDPMPLASDEIPF